VQNHESHLTQLARDRAVHQRQLAFTLRQYDAAGAQHPDKGRWLIDVIEAE